MPGAVLPDDTGTPTANDWHSSNELNIFRLSSQNHVDLPIEVKPGHNAQYLYDDAGVFGGLAGKQRFIVLGDMNADPFDGDSY